METAVDKGVFYKPFHFSSSSKSSNSLLPSLVHLANWLQQEDARMIQIFSATHAVNSQQRKTEHPLMIFTEVRTMRTFKSSVVTRTNHGLHILFARHARSRYGNGVMVLKNHLNLAFQWFGMSHRIMHKSKRYPCLKSAIRPVLRSSEVLIPLFSGFSLKDSGKSDDGDNDDDIIHDAETDEDACFNDTDYEGSSAEPMLFDQNEVSDKKSAEPLASRLTEKNLLMSETRVTFYRNRDAEFIPLFNEDSNLDYCSNVEGVLLCLGVQLFDANSWRLFIDSSQHLCINTN